MTRTSLAALAAILLSTPALAEGPEVHHPVAVRTYEGAPTAAVYFVLVNPGAATRVLTAESDLARRTELHLSTANADGTMSMVEQEDGVPLPEGGEVLFAPGGLHVMLMGLEGAAEAVEVTLTFEDGTALTFDAPFGSREAAMELLSEDHMGMDHGAMDHSEMDHTAGN